MEKLILASASPRRREILKSVGAEFEIKTSNVDESVVKFQEDVGLYVQELALLKASQTAKALVEEKKKNTLVIGADTVVSYDGKILGKPKDAADAERMLQMLSGKVHTVYTGVCVFRTKDAFSVCGYEKTNVEFKELPDELIDSYVKTGEPMDKAGAYGIQGRGAVLCKGFEGDYFNIVGLPISKLYDILKNEFDYKIL